MSKEKKEKKRKKKKEKKKQYRKVLTHTPEPTFKLRWVDSES